MKNKIFITGGAGFIGNELINLISDKKNLVVIDMKKNRKILNKFKKLRVKYISGNLNNRNFEKKSEKCKNYLSSGLNYEGTQYRCEIRFKKRKNYL